MAFIFVTNWDCNNVSVKFLKTLGKHISLNIGEREKEKQEEYMSTIVRTLKLIGN